MIKEIKNLLQQTASINRQYKKIAEITGENYNVFRVLNLQTREVRMHSAFIAELLNPKGNHGQGNVFVIEFIKILKGNLKCLPNETSDEKPLEIVFDAIKAKSAEVESWLGKTTEIEGGYIDILLRDENGKHIVIENKIYAGDQRRQLLRYHNSDKEAPIIYLTLDGKKPSEFSTGVINKNKPKESDVELKANGVDKVLICLSYKDDIKKWLENCKKHTIDHPILRETITQYINLIKYLTNQTNNNDMEKEIVKLLIENKENVEASIEIASNIEKMKIELFKIFAKKLQEYFNSNNPNNFILKYNEEKIGGKDFAFEFINNNYSDFLRIGFINFQTNGIGIYNEKSDQTNRSCYERKLSELRIGKYESSYGNTCIYVITNYIDLKDFDTKRNWSLLANGEFEIVEKVIATVKLLLSAIATANAKTD